MTTGREVLERALYLLGYTDHTGNLDGMQSAELFRRGLPVLNQLYCDLWQIERRGPFCELRSAEEPLRLSVRAVNDILPYGVAMLLADFTGDAANQSKFAALYNQKRSAAGKPAARVRDVLPGRWGG